MSSTPLRIRGLFVEHTDRDLTQIIEKGLGKHRKTNTHVFGKVLDWELTPVEDREVKTQQELALVLHVHPNTVANHLLTIRKERVKALSEDEDTQVENRLLEMALNSTNARFMELYLKLKGKLVDKNEVKVKIERTPDERIRGYLENREWLEQHGYLGQRDREMCPEPEVLHDPLRLHSGQSAPEDSPVGTVGTPD